MLVAWIGDDGHVTDTEVEYSSELILGNVTCKPPEHRRSHPGAPVEVGAEPVGKDAREIAEDAPAGDMSETADLGRLAESSHIVEVERRWCQEIFARVVLFLEDATDERKAVCMHARRRQPDDGVADLDPRPVDQGVTFHEPHARACEVELVLLVDSG